jgi:diguanylate cyclase (GGDEF)-like protein
MIARSFLILVEVLIITLMNYYMASSYFSLDVLYCLPVIQTARLSALQSDAASGNYTIHVVAIACAVAWSVAEAFVVWPNFPISAVLMNTLTRGVTFTIIARVIAKIWKDKELERKDSLTGVANRAEMTRKLEEMQSQSEISGAPFTLLFINIDRFRKFNEEYGYKVGDEVLKQLANSLLGKIKHEDMVGRIASDEFVVLLHDTDENISHRMGARLCATVKNVFNENGWDLNLSFGCASDKGRLKSIDELIRQATEDLKFSREVLLANA